MKKNVSKKEFLLQLKTITIAVIIIFALSLLTGCASFQVSTLNQDQIYSVEGSDVEVKVINNEFQLHRLLRKDFKFRWNFAQYAMNQPYGWYMSNYSFNRWKPYNAFDIYWNSTQYWTNWAFNYPFSYNHWGYSHHNWYNGPWQNQSYNLIWNQSRRNSIAYHNSKRSSNNIENNIVVRNTNRQREIIKSNVDKVADKLRSRLPNKNIKVYNNPNNLNINNNSKPRVYNRPNSIEPTVYSRSINSNNVVSRPVNKTRTIVKNR